MPGLALLFLGAPQIEQGNVVLPFDRRKAIALLAYLAVTGQQHSRDALAALLWPEGDQSHARGSLRRDLSALNKALGGGWLDIDRESVGLNKNADVFVDTRAFRQLIASAKSHSHADSNTCAECLSTLTEAAALYRNNFMAGFTLRDSSQFDDWQFFESESLRGELVGVLTRLVEMNEALGDYDLAVEHARRWLALDPLDEAVHRHLMRLFAAAGQRSAALRQYAECVRILDEELGVPPERETTELYEAVKERRLSPSRPAPSASTNAPRHNLPPELTSFVGRKEERLEVAKMLDDPACRILTLTGPGGVGKTRLALHVAAEKVGEFTHGVWLVALASLGSIDFLESAIADVLGFSFSNQGNTKAQLLNYLRNKQMLLILDNFEHFASRAGLIAEILKNAPQLTLLVTSRQRLNVHGEWTFQVDGLPIPTSENLSDGIEDYAAVQLFLGSARRTDPNFSIEQTEQLHIVDILRMVAGSPLGIELASAWVRMLPSHEIAAKIAQNLDFLAASPHDAPDRHRSLRTTFDYSWDLLSEEEQTVFRHLAVFQGEFQLEAAESIAGASLPLLSALVDKSFLQSRRVRQRKSVVRYTLHGLLQQYGTEKLMEAQDHAAVQSRFRAYYSNFLQEMEALLKGGEQKTAITRIQQDIDNVRAAWHQAITSGETKYLNQSSESLWLFYEASGRYLEGEELFAKAVESLQLSGHTDIMTLGGLLTRQGGLALRLGLVDKSRQLLEESLSLFRQENAQEPTAFTLNVLATAFRVRGNYHEAEYLLRESLAISKEFDNQWLLAYILNDLGAVAYLTGNHSAAKEFHQESLAVSNVSGDRRATMMAYNDLGNMAIAQEDYAEARHLYEEVLALSEEVASPWGIAMAQDRLGIIAYQTGEYAAAMELLQQSLTLRRDMGHAWGIVVSLNHLGNVAYALGASAEARSYFLEALAIASDIRAIRLTLRVLVGLSALAIEEQDYERATDLLTLSSHHPASEEDTKDRAKILLAQIADQTAAQPDREPQKISNLDVLIQELLANQ